MSQQVTVDGQSLSTGYVLVATEDTTTLVDISMKLLELSLLHGEENLPADAAPAVWTNE